MILLNSYLSFIYLIIYLYIKMGNGITGAVDYDECD